MLGYVAREDDRELWLADRKGLWVIKKTDIAERTAWDGRHEGFDGPPVRIEVRDGAELLDVRPTRVRLSERPMALTEGKPPEKGHAELAQRGVEFGRRVGFDTKDLGSSATAGTTWCPVTKCYGDPPVCFATSEPCDSESD
jgi:hypothetical protein